MHNPTLAKIKMPLLLGRGPNRIIETACFDAKVQ